MSITDYFLKHPVIAIVLNAMILLIGCLCWQSLTIREYPEMHFPKVQIQTFYPNASAQLVETAVTYPLEDKLAGIEGIESITSNSRYGGSMIDLSFRSGTSMDRALIAIREAIGLARANLPKDIPDPIVERKTVSSGMPFMVLSLKSSTLNEAELTHYANMNLKNAFRGLKGVAAIEVMGQPYTYDIALDPLKMYAFGVNADEVYDVLNQHNISLPVGKFQKQLPVTLKATLNNRFDFERLVIKQANSNDLNHKQPAVLLKNIAKIRLTPDKEGERIHINGKPGLALLIQRTQDANALDVSALVHQELQQLKPTLPQGLDLNIIIDQAEFIRSSLANIKSAIIEALFLVLIVVFLFLRHLKATLIPLVTIPISLLGSLIFLKLLGFSINLMTLMAMVLAVGLVVDDAIIVLENIHRHMALGLSSLNAALAGAKEIGFAIMAMTLTLASVYAPLIFISGLTGQLFTEFAVALAGSVLISGITALTLSPLMCATLLSKQQQPLWPAIDRGLDKLARGYQRLLTRVIPYQKTAVLVMLLLFAASFALIHYLPHELAPKEDRNLIGIFISPILGKDLDTMEQKLKVVEQIFPTIKEGKDIFMLMGAWGGSVLLPLLPQQQRQRSAVDIVESIRPLAVNIPSIDVNPWSWDSGLPELEDAIQNNGLSLVISSTDTYRSLYFQLEKLRELIDKKQLFQFVSHDLKLDTPGYQLSPKSNVISQVDLSLRQIAKTVEIFFSGDKSLKFTKDGILYPITLRGSTKPWNLSELYVTNPYGKRISLATVASMTPTAEPLQFFHYNQMRSAVLSVTLKPGDNIERSMSQLSSLAKANLPAHYKEAWQGAGKAFSQSQMTMTQLFFLALLFIFAILAVQFENFIDPLIILLTVPLGCFAALLAVWLCGQSINIYTQVGLITLVALISKHGILIVEFASQLRKQGEELLPAIVQATSLRLRPILMTTAPMIFGAVPLVLSHDAGHEVRHIIGTVLIGGLSAGTLFTLFILPTVYYLVKSILIKTKTLAI